MTNTKISSSTQLNGQGALLDLRDELELRRRHLLNELDELITSELHGRVHWQRRDRLVDNIERRLQAADVVLLREFSRKARPDFSNQVANKFNELRRSVAARRAARSSPPTASTTGDSKHE
jgi:hypothetical protein